MKRIQRKHLASTLALLGAVFLAELLTSPRVLAANVGTPAPRQRSLPEEATATSAWSAGFQLGADLANPSVSGTNLGGTLSSSMATGFLAGGQVEYSAGGVWFVEGGLRYDQRSLSGTYTPAGNTTGTSVEAKSSWLDVPLLAKAKFDAGGWSPYLLAGPEFGFKLSESDTNLSSGNNSLKSTNISLNFGAGAEFPVAATSKIFVSASYAPGLSNLANSAGFLSGNTAKLNGVLMTTGMNFSL